MFKKFRSGVGTAVDKITQKELTEKNLQKPLYELQLALIANNVAVPIAEKITKDVEQALIKTKVGRLTSRKKVTYDALKKANVAVGFDKASNFKFYWDKNLGRAFYPDGREVPLNERQDLPSL